VDFEAYVQELSDPAKPLSVSSLVGLTNLGPEQIVLFHTAWREMELRQRARLVEELLELAEDNVELNFDAVYTIALKDRDAGVRKAGIAGLWEHEDSDLVTPFITMLQNDPDPSVRAEAALALGRYVVQGEFARAKPGESARLDQALRDVIQSRDEVPEVRGRALEALGARSEDWVRDLIEECFDSADRPVRLGAIHAMGRSCDATWLADLLPELENDDAEVRFEAARALGSIGDERAVDQLLSRLTDEDLDVAEAAVIALGEIGSNEAHEALQEVVAGDSARLVDAAREALAQLEFANDPMDVAGY
jgi:HEAT repeat protein